MCHHIESMMWGGVVVGIGVEYAQIDSSDGIVLGEKVWWGLGVIMVVMIEW